MQTLGIKYTNIHKIYGNLNKDHFFKYNNHNPGAFIQKDYFILSKGSKSLEQIKLIENNVPFNYFKFKENSQFIVYKLK